MNCWIALAGAALAVAPEPLHAQKTVPNATPATIAGALANVPDPATVAVFEPHPGVPLNSFFADGPNEAVVRNGRFSYRLRHAQVGFVRLDGKYVPRNLLFVEPGARISFTLQPGTGNAPPTGAFGGTNAATNAPVALAALQAELAAPQALLTAALHQQFAGRQQLRERLGLR